MKIKRPKSKKRHSSVSGEKPQTDFDVYKNGAFLGAIFGGVSGLILGKKIILCIIVGAIAGGYVAFQLNKDDSYSNNIKKFTQNKNEENATND